MMTLLTRVQHGEVTDKGDKNGNKGGKLDRRGTDLLVYSAYPPVSFLRQPLHCRFQDFLVLRVSEDFPVEHLGLLTHFVGHTLLTAERIILPTEILVEVEDDGKVRFTAGKTHCLTTLESPEKVVFALAQTAALGAQKAAQSFVTNLLTHLSLVLNTLITARCKLDFPLERCQCTEYLTKDIHELVRRYKEDVHNDEAHAKCITAILIHIARLAIQKEHMHILTSQSCRLTEKDITPKLLEPLHYLSRCIWMLVDPAFKPVFKHAGLCPLMEAITPHQVSLSLIGLYARKLNEAGHKHIGPGYDMILLGCLEVRHLLEGPEDGFVGHIRGLVTSSVE